ncbi:enoyl-CoA hydratase/isomerase family protein [Salipiger marinus]|uniref:enoyl-CoA hydratase/isomerase family protein n=1 Tax=Salipiger marinus TaxID=555512 RepID=UPI002B5EE466|nr:enoyl-CoA hydratase-related protein [Salipiger manganoxidans]MEB3417841.1 enoyl-CoA hydratase-related protein [Salipiger manganoxidans]
MTPEDHSDKIVLERPAAHVAVIRITRPEKKNALHSSMVIELGRLIVDLDRDDDVRCIVLTGTDTIFAAGADIKEMVTFGPPATSNNPRRVAAWRAMETCDTPMIAAVNGIAFGAGSELAMVCDFIIAGETAQFGQPEVKIGGMAGDGGTQRLPRKIGQNVASYMLFTGDPIDVQRAHQLGLVVEICKPEATLARAIEIAEVIAARAPVAVRYTKACIRTAVGATLQNGIAFERDAIWRNSMTEDRQEGMTAFTEKRPPVFRGR